MAPDARDTASAVSPGDTRSSRLDRDTGTGALRAHARPFSDDSGSATIWVLVACLLLGSVAVLPIGRSEIAVTRHRAAVAADLAALGGARLASVDATAACVLAGRVATANGGRLVNCRRVGCRAEPSAASLQVEVATPLPGFAKAVQSGQALAVARAGPPGCSAAP